MDTDGDNPEAKKQRRPQKTYTRTLIISSLVVLVSLAGSWRLMQAKPTSLLPAQVASKLDGFTPYFYEGTVPGGYTFNISRIVYDDELLMIPLTKPDGPTIVLTEQPLSQELTTENLQQNGENVTVNRGTATINAIEGRLVGTLLIRDQRTLILLNSPDDRTKDDLKALLQKLVPIKR